MTQLKAALWGKHVHVMLKNTCNALEAAKSIHNS